MATRFTIRSQSKKILSDTHTPVSLFLKVRDVFAGSIMLESADYHGNENSLSFICCDPIASIRIQSDGVMCKYPDGTVQQEPLSDIESAIQDFMKQFDGNSTSAEQAGLFGYVAYDAVRSFEGVSVRADEPLIPDMVFTLYRYVIRVNHFSNELVMTEFFVDGATPYGLDRLQKLISMNRLSVYPFSCTGAERSDIDDTKFLEMVEAARLHCRRGDVFQLVLSRRFRVGFQGDDFNVYRCLRSVNPSPYLFYFDYGTFRLFGSSPEAQLQVRKGEASIYPIAGTFRRTGNDAEDARLADALTRDEKENAEHVMLVDLARNDLSKNCRDVSVEVFREVQYYSHVIHLVSKVTGQVKAGVSTAALLADSFPAGTLSGAPKHKAVQLIDRYESVNRGFYGGSIGFLGFDGSCNQAIMIRTFLSKNHELISQAGAGIVAASVPENELKEVNNKLAALRAAVKMAETL